jgi:hypothetical protein
MIRILPDPDPQLCHTVYYMIYLVHKKWNNEGAGTSKWPVIDYPHTITTEEFAVPTHIKKSLKRET